ncbi:hypothetical protein [Paenibacillus illinoisensis]|uniref:hypothetical protein n=1 Tax=Paenibacillus illinoisensis TaxID=59845 RepID=UPI003018A331
MMIQSFAPVMDIPYYYPCNFPLIHEVLLRQGSISSLALLAASRLYCLPSCADNGLVKPYFHKLDYEEPIWEMYGQRELGSFEEGKVHMRQHIGEGGLFLATGTSYHLPYCEDYQNPEYIRKHVKLGSRLHLVDHWIAVYGIEDEHFHVYDPVPSKYMGKVSQEAFHEFWKGNQSIPELAPAKRKEKLRTYGTMDVRATGKLDSSGYREMLTQALGTQISEFMTGRTITQGERSYHFGQGVSLHLMKALQEGNEGTRAQANDTLISNLLFDMRWSRYFLRDLLQEAALWLGSPLDQYSVAFEAIIERWEKANQLLQVGRIKQRADWRVQLTSVMHQLIADEWRWYEALRSAVPQEACFNRQMVPRTENGYRDALLRIVLDSCQELNAYHNTTIPLDKGGNAPLYGRDGQLDSLELVSLLAVVEQGLEDEWGTGAGAALSEMAAASLPESPYQTVDSLVSYLERQWLPDQEEDAG